METIKIINNSENHHKEKNKLDSLKSYWYPDRTADIHEVNKGYATWKTDKRLPFLFLISILISILRFFFPYF